MTRRAIAAILALTALMNLGGCGTISMAGYGTPMSNLGGPCEWMDGFGGGTEDIVSDPRDGTIYVSADPRPSGGRRGGIWRVVIPAEGRALKAEVTGGRPEHFHPHGIDIWRNGDIARLFAINHVSRDLSRIEVFDIQPDGSLSWLAGAAYEELKRPNDIAVVGPAAFYATRDHRARRALDPTKPSFWEMAEDSFALPLASVVYVEHGKAKVATGGLAFADGIDVSQDGRWVYVTETSAGRVAVFRRRQDQTLVRVKTHPAGPMPDNITVAPDGLWYGAHSRLWNFLRYAKGRTGVSPGRVEVMDPDTGHRRVVFRDDGSWLSALSVGVPVGPRVAVGSIFRDRIGLCLPAQR